MTQVLAAVTTTGESQAILRFAADLATHCQDELVVVNAFEQPYAELNEQWSEELHDDRERLLRDETVRAGVADQVTAVEVLDGEPHATLAERGSRMGVRAVVVGQHGVDGTGGVHGTGTAAYLGHHAACPVVVIDRQDLLGDGPIVVGVDGSEANQPALAFAEHLGVLTDRRVVAVLCPDELSDSFPHPAHKTLQPQPGHRAPTTTERPGAGWAYPREDAVYKELEAGLESSTTMIVEPGAPETVLPRIARRDDAAAIVVGTRGWGSFGGTFLGSVPRKLLATSDRPLVIVPHHHQHPA